jgi:hypothetical protein
MEENISNIQSYTFKVEGDYETQILDFVKNNLNISEEDIKIKSIVLGSKKEADDYSFDMLEISNAIAIRYLEADDDFDTTETGIDINSKIDKVVKDYNNLPNQLVDKLKDFKSDFKGCNHCGSKLSRAYIVPMFENNLITYSENRVDDSTLIDIDKAFDSIIACPICKDRGFIISTTDKNRIISLHTKYSNLLDKKRELHTKYLSKKDKVEYIMISIKD